MEEKYLVFIKIHNMKMKYFINIRLTKILNLGKERIIFIGMEYS